MTLTSKQRATLRSKANQMPAIFHVGKDGINPEFIIGVRDALEARELIKIDLNQNCELEVEVAAEIVSSRTGAILVQIIGRKFILYRKSKTRKEGVL